MVKKPVPLSQPTTDLSQTSSFTNQQPDKEEIMGLTKVSYAMINGAPINVLDYGVTGDGSTDDTTAIQSALTACDAAGGGVVYFPTGTYKITSTIDLTGFENVTIQGENVNSTRFAPTITDNNYFTFTNAKQCKICSVSIIPTVTQTTGSAVYFSNGYNLTVSDVIIGYGVRRGISLLGGADQFIYTIENFIISNCATGIYIDDTPQDVFISTGLIGSCTASGISMISGSGIYVENVDVISCNTGISTYPSTGKTVANLFFDSVLCDTCTTDGWAFFTNGGDVRQINMSNCWGATNGNNGLHFGNCNSVAVTNFRAFNNQYRGIYVQAGVNYSFSNCQAVANSMVSSNSYDGMSIDGVGVTDVSIIGGVYGNTGGWPGYNNQKNGIGISSGSINNYVIIGADLTGNVTAGLTDGGTGTTKYIYGNSGYKTSNSGTATITSGTSVTVTHGLSITPTSADISVTPTSSIGANSLWVDTITSTTFKINTSGSVTATFAWQARTAGA
jgi:hypothetical protein